MFVFLSLSLSLFFFFFSVVGKRSNWLKPFIKFELDLSSQFQLMEMSWLREDNFQQLSKRSEVQNDAKVSFIGSTLTDQNWLIKHQIWNSKQTQM